ncbi:MAG: glycosyltransferase family 2 protein [Bacteroidota bacterium]
MISVILVQFNNGGLTVEAVRTLRAFHREAYEIIVVDNGSDDGSSEILRKELSDIRIIVNERNEGFGAANNRAAAEASGDILLFLNNDTVSTSDYLSRAAQIFRSDASLGVLGPRLLFPDNTFQLSAGALPTFWNEAREKALYALERRNVSVVRRAAEKYFSQRRDVGWVTGAALLIRRDLFQQIGGYDPLMFMYFEDKDLCARVSRLGKRVVYDPSMSVVHLKGGSSSGPARLTARTAYRRSQIRYYEMHRPGYEQWLLRLYLRLTGRLPHA